VDKSLLKKEDFERSEKVQDRWDALDVTRLDSNMKYGEFLTAKVSKVFPLLKDQNQIEITAKDV